ncbi:MAG: HAD family hydrolase [Candidatus Syntrophonatronum acetioxidans]|uniref:phosphoserine phosphatase n=1 Tax=Candidatus Syntrophonatronum acetioxidans TaxID=1795816 RepID=A0A424YGY9_9FIRM|nr:MAG: HAD family hydrolase [Candidatus Syntrophonatronum acetioxidans]
MSSKHLKDRVKLVAFDVDGTLTVEKSAWEYAHRKFGLWKGEGEKYLDMFLAGQISYAEFARLDALRWKGIPYDKLVKVLEEISYVNGAIESVEAIQRSGVEVALISCGLMPLVERIAKELDIKYYVGNELKVKNGYLTGEAKVNVSLDLDSISKGAYLKRLSKGLNITTRETAAVGDGIGDLDMFKVADISLLVNCTPDHKKIILESIKEVIELDCVSTVPHVLGFKGEREIADEF